MKIIKTTPTIFKRIKSGFPLGIKTIIALTGIAGTIIRVLTLTGIVFKISEVLEIGLGCVIISFIVTIIKGHINHLPSQIIFEESIDGTYVAKYCTRESLKEANSLTKPFYHHEYVDDNIVELWRQKNTQGFVGIFNSKNELCACFGIIGIEESFMNQFIKGRLKDNDMLSEDVLSFEETKKSSTPYISGVVVRDPDSPAGHRRACVMIWTMLEYIKKIFGFRKERHIFALAVSKTSENLLKKCGFQMYCTSTQRKDKLNLYQLPITKEAIDNILIRTGDYSMICKIQF